MYPSSGAKYIEASQSMSRATTSMMFSWEVMKRGVLPLSSAKLNLVPSRLTHHSEIVVQGHHSEIVVQGGDIKLEVTST